MIDLVAAAQGADGYMNSYYTVAEPGSAGPTSPTATSSTAPATWFRRRSRSVEPPVTIGS